jgi:two-component system response regulator DesR
MTPITELKSRLAGLVETLSLLTAQARASQKALPNDQVQARLALAVLERLIQQAYAEAEDIASLLDPENKPEHPLTKREMEILHLASEGLTNKEIAYRLGLSERTVQFHLNSVFNKTGTNSRTEATTAAFRQGWLS